jgi:hypothetical protein
VREVWVSGNWGELLSSKVFFAVGLFIFSLLIPRVLKRFRKE